MYKNDDVNVVGQLYLPSLSIRVHTIEFIGVYVCIRLKIARTVDNQNFETASITAW